jgi:hypothetical protein
MTRRLGGTEIILDQLVTSARKAVPQLGSFTDARTELRVVEDTVRGMMLELRSAVLAAQVLADRQDVAFEMPASWWQHLKRDRMPAWFTRRWPVRTRTLTASVDFTRYDTYPMADIALPPDEFGYPVRIEMFSLRTEQASIRQAVPSGDPRYKYASRQVLSFLITNNLIDDDPNLADVARRVVHATFSELARYGVNPDQLVREDILHSMRKP